MKRMIAAAAMTVCFSGAAWAACSGGSLPDGKGGCYYPPFASADWYKKQKIREARMRRLCAMGRKWACPGSGPVVR
ncbi:hypothetical protein [Rhodomicrobium sp.]|uniref:hypothetical protein n=1 Tax=Rhodomicrobium sp. TaxID=2720632 RepID=UPI0039E636D2